MSLLQWLEDEPTTLEDILSVKPKPIKIGEDVNEDILYEIDRGSYCTVCNHLVDGVPCNEIKCPW